MNLIGGKTWMGVVALCLLGSISAGARTYQSYEGKQRPDQEIMRVLLPEDVVLLQVDGKETKEGRFLAPRVYESVELMPGEHTLTVRYLELWDYDQRDDFEKIRSAPVSVDLPSTAPGIYQLTHPGARSMEEAKALAASFAPTVTIVETFLAKPVAPIAEAEPPVAEVTQPGPALGSVVKQADAPPGFSVLELMKYCWRQASPDEREAFRKWLEQQAQ